MGNGIDIVAKGIYQIFGTDTDKVEFANKIIEKKSEIKINIPPIVGVPTLLIKWFLGPSFLIGCPSFWIFFKIFINFGPKNKDIKKAVKRAPPALKVR